MRAAFLLLIAALVSACASMLPITPERTGGGTLNADAERFILVTIENHRTPAPAEAGSTLHGYGPAGAYTVNDAARATATALARDYALEPVREWPIDPLHVDCVVFAVSARADRGRVLQRLAADRRVKLAQPMQLFESLAAGAGTVNADPAARVAYNDPYLPLQHGFAAIDATGAQRYSRGDGVRIAIIDTGADLHHPDLPARIASRNFIDDDERAFESDRHGTEIVGIIAAVTNNGVGIAGIAPAARLRIYKACEPLQPQALEARCNSFTLALALGAAISDRAQVVNMSLAGPADPLLMQLVTYGVQHGMIFVAARPSGPALGFPLDVAGVIGADQPGTDQPGIDQPASGGGAARGRLLHAPARDIVSLAPGGHYDFASGTSYAAAHVSAAIALLLARAPRMDAANAFDLLSRTTTHSEEGDVINVAAALDRLDGGRLARVNRP